MKIHDFINSRDIAEYLKDINYQFSTLECAWLVWQSRKHTLKQKHAAWQEIIDTMPDCSVEARPTHEKVESLHGYLIDFMKCQNQHADEFFTPRSNAYYLGSAYNRRDEPGEAGDFLSHLTVEDCLQYLDNTYGDFVKIHTYVVTKQLVGGGHSDEWKASLNEDKELLDIFSYGERNLFAAQWLDFPTPFEKGDILEITKDGYESIIRGDFDYGMERFVVTAFYDRPGTELLQMGCFEDMAFRGYYAGYEKLLGGKRGSYMDFERAGEALSGSDILLLPLSLHFKEQLDDVEMMEAYCILKMKNELLHIAGSNSTSDRVRKILR